MAEADALQQRLLMAQNPDGGWGYRNGSSHTDSSRTDSSWTEPTALALIALAAHRNADAVRAAGVEWLMNRQRSDGGWAPQPGVEQSTWVTSLASVGLSGIGSAEGSHKRGIRWLIGQILPEDGPASLFMSRMLGLPLDPRPVGGSAWFPGTAAWVGPTAMSIVALCDPVVVRDAPQSETLVREGQEFILSRRCQDGGWNHGGSKYRSDNASSYPEMTGMALLALRGVEPSQLTFPIERAIEFVHSAPSVEALSWLQLGLLAHGRDYRGMPSELPCRTIRDISLRLLALAGKCSTNKFLIA